MDREDAPGDESSFDRTSDAARLAEIEAVLAAVEAELAELDPPAGHPDVPPP